MRIGIVAVAGLGMAASVGLAQQSSEASAKQMPRYVLVGPGCPGQFSARQQSTGGATMWTTAIEDKDKKDHGAASMGVHVDFESTKSPVRSLELSVSYLPAGLRAMPVTPGVMTKSPAESKKTFDLAGQGTTRVDGDLLVGPAATITRVHLMSATYADGAVWHAANASTCSIEPDRVVLVGEK